MLLRSMQYFLLFSILVRACAAEALPEIYVNPHHGFSLSIPRDWTRYDDKGNECEATFTLPHFGAVTIGGVALEPGVDLAQFEKQAMQQPSPEISRNLLGLANFKPLAFKDVMLASLKARLIEFTAEFNGLEVKGCFYLAVNNDRGFLLCFETLPDNYANDKQLFINAAQTLKVQAPDKKELSTFSSKKYRISLRYPATWYVIELQRDWVGFCAPKKIDASFCENMLLMPSISPQLGFDAEHERFVREIFQELCQKPGCSEMEAPKPAVIGNMRGLHYAMNQISPTKAILRQDCYSATRGNRHFNFVCTTSAVKTTQTRTLFDTILKSIQADEVPVKWLEQKDEHAGYLINYPDNWMEAEPQKDTLALWIPKKIPNTDYLFEAMTSIWSQSVDMNYDLERCAATQKINDQREKGYHFISEDTIKLNGVPAVRQVLTQTYERVDVKILRYVIVGRHREYIIDSTAPLADFDRHLETFEKISSGFQLLPVPAQGGKLSPEQNLCFIQLPVRLECI